jgi:hypothetical protein
MGSGQWVYGFWSSGGGVEHLLIHRSNGSLDAGQCVYMFRLSGQGVEHLLIKRGFGSMGSGHWVYRVLRICGSTEAERRFVSTAQRMGRAASTRSACSHHSRRSGEIKHSCINDYCETCP